MKIAIEAFKGEIPAVADNLLPIQNSKKVFNAKLTKGDLRPWPAPMKEEDISGTSVQTIFQYAENGNVNWVAFAEDVDYILSPLTGEAYERLYFTGLSEPRVFANDLAGSPFDPDTDYYKMGVPAPTTAPTIAAGYSTASEYRAYVYIFVNAYGEQGPPSPVDSISDYGSGNVPIEDIESAPSNRQIDKIYLYRTSASGSGVATFRFVLEATWFDTSTSYAVGDYVIYATDLYKCTTTHPAGAWNAGHFTAGDDVTDSNLSIVTLESETWDPPPTGLKGLIILPNGIAAGFVGNDIYLSEPYQVHAWPTDYIVSVPQDVIGIGSFGTTIVVATNGDPYIISGQTPLQMSLRKIKGKFPCLSKRSIVSSEFGVQFITSEGMLRVNESGITVDTAAIMNPSDVKDYNPTTISGIVYSGKYFGFYQNTDLDLDYRGFVIDYAKNHITELDFEIYCGYISEDDGQFYIAANDEYDESDPPANKPLCIKQWEGDSINYLYYSFRTKRFVLPYEVNFAAARIILDEEFYNEILQDISDNQYLQTLNQTIFAGDILGAVNDDPINSIIINGDLLNDLQTIDISSEITFKVYADDVLKFTKNVTNNKIFKMRSGFKSKFYEFVIEGHIPVLRVDIATSSDEIMRS